MSYQAFGFGMSPVEVPDQCLRCGSGMLDHQLDFLSRDPDLLAWYRFKKAAGRDALIVIVLSVVTLGAWLSIFGLWSLAMLPRRMAMKRAALEAAPNSVRSACRACGLQFYPGEAVAATA